MSAKFPQGKLLSMADLIQKGEWDVLKEVQAKGQPAHSARSQGYSYRGSYYVLRGRVNYGEEIKIGQWKKDCGC